MSAAGDPAIQARLDEAAETLAEYLDQPGVRAALETAANGDVSLNVRRQAQRSLASSER
jgi:predicted ArsR family transcriptional regulator